MNLDPLGRAAGRKVGQCLHCSVYLAMAILTALVAAHAQSAIPAASERFLTQTGTLLSRDAPQLVLDSTVQPESRITELGGAVTLPTNGELPAIGSENPFVVNNLRVRSSYSFVSDEVSASPISQPSFETSFAALALSQEGTAAFEEMTPLPEPSTWLAACVAFAIATWQQRRRFRFRRLR